MQVRRWTVGVMAAAATAGLLTGCGSAPSPATRSAHAARPSHGAGPATVTPLRDVKLTAGDLSSLAQDDDRFAGDLVRAMTATGAAASGGAANTVVSPTSVAIVLQMLADGAGGRTRSQLISALHDEGLGGRELTAAAAGLFAELRGLGSQLSISDDVWLQHGLDVSPSYAADLRRGFAAGLHDVDFANSVKAARTINDAISRDTHGHIAGLLTPDALDGALAVLTDAVYLKADWAHPFQADQTRPAPFTTADGRHEQVPTMHQTAGFDYVQHDGFQAVTLPYAKGRLAMSVLLPAPGSSPAAIEALAAKSGWSALLSGATPTPVTLSLPKFETRTTVDLTSVLEHLGITDAFTGAADLTGICRGCDVSGVEHQAWIKTDEKGTTAAAATAAVIGTLALARDPQTGVVVNVDRPFLAVVRDTRTGLPLFVASIGDPAAG